MIECILLVCWACQIAAMVFAMRRSFEAGVFSGYLYARWPDSPGATKAREIIRKSYTKGGFAPDEIERDCKESMGELS